MTGNGKAVSPRVASEGKGLNSTMYSALLVCFILGASGSTQRKMKGGKVTPTHLYANQSGWLCGNLVVPGGGLPGPAPAAGVQCVQVQLLQVRAIELGGGRPQRCPGESCGQGLRALSLGAPFSQ